MKFRFDELSFHVGAAPGQVLVSVAGQPATPDQVDALVVALNSVLATAVGDVANVYLHGRRVGGLEAS